MDGTDRPNDSTVAVGVARLCYRAERLINVAVPSDGFIKLM